MSSSAPWYLAHRLFAAHDRVLATELAQALEHIGIRSYLPFCDSNEAVGSSGAEHGRRIYERDIEAMSGAVGVVALLHGPVLDDGVLFELGFGLGRGLPLVGVSTDFQYFGLSASGGVCRFADPIVEVSLSQLVDVPAPLADGRWVSRNDHLAMFAARNRAQVVRAISEACEAVSAGPPGRDLPRTMHDPRRVYWETRPGRAHARPVGAERLDSHNYLVSYPTRWSAMSTAEGLASALSDLHVAMQARTLILDIDDVVVPAGAALLAGVAVALDREVYAVQQDERVSLAPHREPNRFNLMIHYSCRTIRASWLDVVEDVLGAQ